MDVHKTYATFQRFSPASFHDRVRQVATAVLTPLRFAMRTGHFKSSLRSGSFTSQGEVIPWYTYPAIDFLARKEFDNRSVLEFGSGNSTLWWAQHARRVVALENDSTWYEKVSKSMPQNVSLHHIADFSLTGAESHIGEDPFDIVVVDGFDRFKAAQIAVNLLAKDGAIIVDNAEGFWGPEGTYPIMDLLRQQSFSRVDFYGFAPGVIRRHCTSIAFRGNCFLFDGVENPEKFD